MGLFQTDVRVKLSLTELTNLLTETGLGSGNAQFAGALEKLNTAISQPSLDIELVSFSEPDATHFQKIAFWLAPIEFTFAACQTGLNVQLPNDSFWVKGKNFETVSSNQLGAIPSPISIFIIQQSDLKMADIQDKMLACSNEKTYIIIITDGPMLTDTSFRKDLEQNAFSVEWLDGLNLPEKKFCDRLAEPDFMAMANNIYNYCCLIAIDSLNNILGLMLEQEERSIKARKALNQQNVIKVQSQKAFSANDMLMQLKNNLTNQYNLLEKGISDAFENVLRPNTGDYSKKVEEKIGELEHLDLSEKTKTMALSIPPEFEKSFYNIIYDNFIQYGQGHMITLRDAFKNTEKDIEKFCEANGLPGFTLNFRYLTDSQLTIILDSSIRSERPFEGSLPKRGVYEYFMAVRKYQMFVFMIISTFGLTFVRSMTVYMIPATIILLGFGGYNVHKSVVSESEESNEKELEKAKDLLRSEARRIAGDVSRQWMRVVSDHIRNQLAQNFTIIESYLKEVGAKLNMEDEENKKKVQRQSQTLDNSDRKLGNIARMRDNFFRNLQKNKMDTKQAYLMLARKGK